MYLVTMYVLIVDICNSSQFHNFGMFLKEVHRCYMQIFVHIGQMNYEEFENHISQFC